MVMHPIRYEAVDPPRGPQPYPSMDERRDLITTIVQPLDTETVLSQPTRTSSAPVTMSWIGQSLGATGGESSDDLPPECVLPCLTHERRHSHIIVQVFIRPCTYPRSRVYILAMRAQRDDSCATR
jgi:hypothetical protein